jgi:hypothetical protein
LSRFFHQNAVLAWKERFRDKGVRSRQKELAKALLDLWCGFSRDCAQRESGRVDAPELSSKESHGCSLRSERRTWHLSEPFVRRRAEDCGLSAMGRAEHFAV